jgi:hypothetical protein
MMRRYAARLPALVGLPAVFWVQPALAQDDSCSPMAIEADAAVTARWPGLLRHVREAFDAREDIDRSARVTLTLRAAAIGRRTDGAPALSPFESIAVEVELPDGRSASRLVSRREDVVPTLEALLLVPQRSASVQTSAAEPSGGMPPPANAMAVPPEEPAPSPAGARVFPLRRELAVPDRDASGLASRHEPSRLGIELSVLTGARAGGGQSSVGLGALSFLDLSGWLVGFEGRADRYHATPTASPGGALEVAVLGGRRFRFGDVALDLTAGLAAAMQGTATYVTQPANTGNTVSESSSSTVPRLLAGARLTFGAYATLRAFLGLDGEVGPPRADGADVPGAPRLPVATLGLALGATVGTR